VTELVPGRTLLARPAPRSVLVDTLHRLVDAGDAHPVGPLR
jgi:hypothetical protein